MSNLTGNGSFQSAEMPFGSELNGRAHGSFVCVLQKNNNVEVVNAGQSWCYFI